MNSRSEAEGRFFGTVKPGTKMYAFIQFAKWGVILYFAYCCLLFLMQRWMVFPGIKIPAPPGAMAPVAGLERMWLNTSFGRVEAWFLPPEADSVAGPAPVVIFAHGNAELIDFWPEEIRVLTHFGLGVLLVEYPGYGRSEGAPSQESVTEAFVAGYDVLVAREEVDASRIVFMGRSLGGGAACALAAERPSAALILISTFTGIRPLAWRFLAPGFLVRDPFDNLKTVRAYSGPVLVVHGRRDDIIPYGHGEALARAAQNGKLISYDCRHNDCPPDWEAFWKEAASFLHDAGIIY